MAACALALAFVAGSPVASAATHIPAWLVAQPGTLARVDIAPWLVSDEPEAALTDGAASSSRDFTADATRPGDVRYAAVGVRVRIERILPRGQVALVHALGERWQAYARIERLVPDVPIGTGLVAAGGFGGFADFYAALDTGEARAERLPTGSRLVVLGTGVAPYDPNNSDLVRLHVKIASGAWRGRRGWIATAYTGLPVEHLASGAEVAERACKCRLIQFDLARP